MKSWGRIAVGAMGALMMGAVAAETTYLKPEKDQVAVTNAFMEAALALHKRIIAEHETRREESTGGYRGFPEFYREVRYYDQSTGKLLSKVQWEQANPKQLHALEVYVYDEQGRLVRDYSGWYTPEGHNAPRDTWITLHGYSNGLHAMRQFDALDNRIYEKCEGEDAGKPVDLVLWELDIAVGADKKGGVMQSPLYRKCFASLPAKSAGRYLTPQ